MADAVPKTRGYRAIPRQGMRKWSVVHDVAGMPVVVADFHSYPAAMAECMRLNALVVAEDKVKISA